MKQNNRTTRFQSLALVALGVCLGWLTAGARPQAIADEKDKEPRAFLSGGERAVVELKKISGQITKLDARIARIETKVAGKTK